MEIEGIGKISEIFNQAGRIAVTRKKFVIYGHIAYSLSYNS